MFKFNFNQNSSDNENENEDLNSEDSKLTWLPAKKIDVPSQFEEYKYKVNLNLFELKLVDGQEVTSKLAEKCNIILEAESKNSDLLPAKYEGGLKIWECTSDLGNYLRQQNIAFKDKRVLDLGCGAGVLGIIALLKGASVDFQDYNSEVIENVTIPNVILNSDHLTAKKCDYYCGDWESLLFILCENSKQYDYIFTSETIYNQQNHKKLYNIFKKTLKKDGIGFIAGKSLYFGVGGTMRQFEQIVLDDDFFDVSVPWKNDLGIQREILMLQRKSIS